MNGSLKSPHAIENEIMFIEIEVKSVFPHIFFHLETRSRHLWGETIPCMQRDQQPAVKTSEVKTRIFKLAQIDTDAA